MVDTIVLARGVRLDIAGYGSWEGCIDGTTSSADRIDSFVGPLSTFGIEGPKNPVGWVAFAEGTEREHRGPQGAMGRRPRKYRSMMAMKE